jgi:hypothetical protein
MSDQLTELEKRIAAIEARNRRVDADKGWETSLLRRTAIAAITYAVAGALLIFLNTPHWPLAACMPVLGYLLSTITLGVLKRRWIAKHHKGVS